MSERALVTHQIANPTACSQHLHRSPKLQHPPVTFVFDLHNCQTTWHPRQRKSPASQPRKLWPRSPLLVARRAQRRPLRATRSTSTRCVAQLVSHRSLAFLTRKVARGANLSLPFSLQNNFSRHSNAKSSSLCCRS